MKSVVRHNKRLNSVNRCDVLSEEEDEKNLEYDQTQ